MEDYEFEINQRDEQVRDAEAIARVLRIINGSTFQGHGAESVVAGKNLLVMLNQMILDSLNSNVKED